MQRRTIIVDGPLAFRMRRIAAARASESGLDILTMPLLAARLAGGFVRPASAGDIEQAVRGAFDAGGFQVLQRSGDLPGIVRAAAQSLRDLWDEGRTLEALPAENAQVADMALLEARVREHLPAGVLSALDLRDAALARIAHGAILGKIELDRVFYIAPVWRPVLLQLQEHAPVAWRDAPEHCRSWWRGGRDDVSYRPSEAAYVACANPRAEVVESLRWLRLLLSSGVAPATIGVAAVNPEAWDDHFIALARAHLPLHFAHGLPALATHPGQACAALADILLRGLNQERFRRLARYRAGSAALGALDASWNDWLPRAARLTTPEQWAGALDAAWAKHSGRPDPRPVLAPALRLLARGGEAALEAGAQILPPAARPIWKSALTRAPLAAVEQSLRDLRLADASDPAACAVWGPTSLLVGAPRPHMRLLGLTSRAWPRARREDPMLPPHVLDLGTPEGMSAEALDRAAFAHLCARATASCVISKSRRNAQGARFGTSPLVADIKDWAELRRERTPEHAFSEADRLQARPGDARSEPALVHATRCYRDWRLDQLTAHDGRVRSDHPRIIETLTQSQSATRLRLMLRDPLAYVWRYALGWRPPRDMNTALALSPRDYGDLVHDMLRRAIVQLGRDGFAGASADQISHSVDESAAELAEAWPLDHATPPGRLWQFTINRAAEEAKRALGVPAPPETRSYAELGFGRDEDEAGADLPWRPNAEVVLATSGLKINGFIDRLDYRDTDYHCRVTDYKTGEGPRERGFTIRFGLDVQRVLYTIAVRQLAPQTARVQALLIYLGGKKLRADYDNDLDPAPLEKYVAVAARLLKSGLGVSGIDAFEDDNDYALALPADEAYQTRKQGARAVALTDLSPVWRVK
ncbi:MAG: PD-(D/E)XK nuclease family protein [Hyphomonadaceae bacterium]|nr:PD-(D/E)XK nuclease family protein [Hyphomonadaceae bacterium]